MKAEEAEANRMEAVANLETARREQAKANQAAEDARKANLQAQAAKQRADTKAKEAQDSLLIANEQRQRAEAGERQQKIDLFESYLTQGILRSALGDYGGAGEALHEASLTAKPVDGTNIVAAPRRSLRNLLDWFTSISGSRSSATYAGEASPLKSVAVSPDGRLIVAGGENGSLYVYQTGDTAPSVIPAHKELVTDIEFFPDGLVVASAGVDRMVRLFAVSAAIGRGDSAPVLESYRQWRAGAPIRALAISPDGNQLVTGDEAGDLVVWNAKTGEPRKILSAHDDEVRDVKFNADGTRLVSVSFDRSARVWITDERGAYRSIFTTPKTEDRLVGAALNPRGDIAAAAGTDGVIRLWNVSRQESVQRLSGHRNVITDLLFDTHSGHLISGSLDRTIRTWEVASGVRQQVLQGHESGVTSLSLRRGALFSCSNDQTVRRWRLDAGVENSRTVDLGDRSPRAIAISPQNHRLAVGFADGAISLFSLPHVEELDTFKAHSKDITRIRFSPDGRRLASGSFDHRICYLEAQATGLRLLRAFSNHVDVVNDIAFSPDGGTLASASIGSPLRVDGDTIETDDERIGQIALLDLETGNMKSFPAHKHEVFAVTFDATGEQLLSSGDDGHSIVWNHRNGILTVARRIHADPDMAYTAQFQPLGQQIATAGRSGTLRVFDHETSEPIANLPGHENAILGLAYTPDGGHIVTASADRTLRLWDIERSRAAFVLRLPALRSENPLWDFAFNYNAVSGGWIAVPLTEGKLILHHFGLLFDMPASNRMGQNAR